MPLYAPVPDRISVTASSLGLVAGSPSLSHSGAGTATARASAWLLDAAASETVSTNLIVPQGWTAASLTAWVRNVTTSAGDIVLQANWAQAVTTGDFSTVTDLGTVTATAPGTTTPVTSVTLGSLTGLVPGRILRVSVQRVGGDVADTLANDIALVLVDLVRT